MNTPFHKVMVRTEDGERLRQAIEDVINFSYWVGPEFFPTPENPTTEYTVAENNRYSISLQAQPNEGLYLVFVRMRQEAVEDWQSRMMHLPETLKLINSLRNRGFEVLK